MTISIINKPNWSLALGGPLLIFLVCLFTTLSPKFTAGNQLLSAGILADLLITAPLVYFLAIRKSNVSKLTVTRIFMAGLLFAGFIFPAHSSPILQIIKTWISPVIEAYIIFIISKKFYIANKDAKAKNNNKVDFLLHCRRVMLEICGSQQLANIVSSEFAVIYYAFRIGKTKSPDYKTTFTSYKENGLPIVFVTLLSILLIETTGVHFLLSVWSKPIAWTFTGLSLYTCIQLFAHSRALKARPIMINSDSIGIHNGLAGDAFIQLDNIEKIELTTKKPAGNESVKIALLKGLENHNIVVYLKSPIELTKVFGIKKHTDTVLFFVDKPKAFIDAVKSRLADDGI